MSMRTGGRDATYESRYLNGKMSVLKLSPIYVVTFSFLLITMIEFCPLMNQARATRKFSIERGQLRKNSPKKVTGQ
jgi:DNA-binding protein Fis